MGKYSNIPSPFLSVFSFLLASLALNTVVRNLNDNLDAAIPSTIPAFLDFKLTYSSWSWAKNSDDIYRSHPIPMEFEFPKEDLIANIMT